LQDAVAPCFLLVTGVEEDLACKKIQIISHIHTGMIRISYTPYQIPKSKPH
jgi:hypothetical protein